MRVESSGKPDAWKLARPVWGWGRGEIPRPTPRDGLAQFYKRLEAGTFEMLRPEGEAATVEIDATELAMLLSGVSLCSAKRRKRYRRAGWP